MKNEIIKKVLVTGANGFIGSYLCDALLNEGYEVIGLSYGDKNKIKHLHKNSNFKLLECDITNFSKIEKIIKKYKPEGVFHVAALLLHNLENSPFPFFNVNVGGTWNVLEACRLHNVKEVVYSSSMSVYGHNIDYIPVDEKHPVNPYDFYSLTKLLGEEICNFYSKKYNMNIVTLRYAGVYGVRRLDGAVASFAKQAIDGKPLKIAKNISWDIIGAKDVAKANISAFKKAKMLKSEIINIGSGKEVNIKDLAEKIIKFSGSKSKINISEDFHSLQSSHFYYNISKAKKLLGFKPQDFDESLTEYIRAMRNG